MNGFKIATDYNEDIENHPDYPLPFWAISRSNGNYMDIGAQLRTRDGRRCGNAFVNNLRDRPPLGIIADVVTDAGSSFSMTLSELEEAFYPPIYIMNLLEARIKFCRVDG